MIQLDAPIYGEGKISVMGRMSLLGSFAYSVNISDVDIEEGGALDVIYLSSSSQSAASPSDFVSSNNNRADDVFGHPLAFGEISITIPSTRKADIPITYEEHQAYVHFVSREFYSLFGGCSSSPSTGYWMSPVSNQVIKEEVTVVSTSVTPTKQVKHTLRQIARWIAREMEQEAVFVKVNHVAYLVYAS
eukprot:TRINITY_DN6554_c0_g1_i1.p1 TRINITY_DN6554_c0_g1~~TRINITY_DN6554_c0_g1_i1.p1  ORF type:complete len:189 (-),score=73.95 TRINITY_DN6554_c0_g1_i1:12-578(-)